MNFLRRFWRFFFNRFTLVLFGLVLLSLAIWFIGPLISIAGWTPLDRERTRWIIIISIFAIFAIRLLIGWWRRKNLNAKLLNQLAKVQDRKSTEEEPLGAREVGELRKRFQDAIETLKKTRLTAKGKAGWWSSLGRQYIYQLPWYMFIGAPGSGKTTALVNSGLNFPLADKFGKAALRGVGGTRNCDWWFTNEAVLLDTAGRYTTHESNEALDKSEWSGFLNLLKKFRPKQPLNGVMLTVSVSDLLTMPEAERDLHAAALRKRLYELRDSLQIQFPVYIVVTKCDLLAGFNEFFANLDREDRAQVWGFTFPYDETRADPKLALEKYSNEFNLLSERLYRGLDEVLLREPDLARRALIYALPQQFAGLRDVLGKLLDGVFVESKFGEQPLLRGVYFTSGTQEGTPLDRVLGSMARAFKLNSSVAASVAAQGQGRSYFIQHLLQQLIFSEAHLAGRNEKWERNSKIYRNVGIACCALGLIGAVVAWFYSHSNNKDYLAEVDSKTLVASRTLAEAAKNPQTDLANLSALLDQVRSLSASEKFAIDAPPMGYRYGLYQGKKMDSAAVTAYQRLLEDGLLAHISKRVEVWLQQPGGSTNHELTYETLKAYLMLHEPKYYDGAFLRAFADGVLARELPADTPREQRDRLSGHVNALFDGRAVSSPYQKDDELIRRAREKLGQFSLSQLSYLRLKRRLENNELGEFTIPKAAGPQAASVFRFKSNKPLTNGVPGLFTFRGYHGLFKKEVDSVATKFSIEESWVLDGDSKSATQRAEEISKDKLGTEVKRLYLNEYADTWDAFLRDMTITPSADLQRSIQTTRILSAPDSPLSLFVKAASKETTLLREERVDNQSIVGRAVERAKSGKNDIERIIGTGVIPTSQPREKLELIVDNRFESLRRLAQNPNGQGPAPIDATVIPLINELHVALSGADAAIRAGNTPAQSDVITKLNAESSRFPTPIRELLNALSAVSSAQAASMIRSSVTANADAAVGQFCRKAVAGRYPLTRGATQEVTPGDFAQLFAPGGLMDDFFQKNLASMVDISTNPWSFKRSVDGAPAGGASALVAFQRAQVIRDVFFRGGTRTPQVSFSIKPVEMDAAITQLSLDVDGQVLRYAHGPQLSQTMTWPGPRGSNQVRLQLTPQSAGSSGLLHEGPWALHRFFDKVQLTPSSSPERFIATMSVDGRKAVFEVIANSVQNPFALRSLTEFSCPSK
jgi:type VI secretion system protein ImpL